MAGPRPEQDARTPRLGDRGRLYSAGIYRHDGQDEPRSLERFLTVITNHIPHHLKFVSEKRRALGLDS